MREWADTRRLLWHDRRQPHRPQDQRHAADPSRDVDQPDGVLARIAVAMSALVRTTDSGWTLRHVR